MTISELHRRRASSVVAAIRPLQRTPLEWGKALPRGIYSTQDS